MLSHLHIINLTGDDKPSLENHTVFTHNVGYGRVCFCFNLLISLNYNFTLLDNSYQHRLWLKQENIFSLQCLTVQCMCLLSVT